MDICNEKTSLVVSHTDKRLIGIIMIKQIFYVLAFGLIIPVIVFFVATWILENINPFE